MKHISKLAAASIAAIVLAATPTLANEANPASRSPGMMQSYESGFEPTQRRIGRGRRGVVVVGPRRRNNVGRNIAIGVGAAVIGGMIASEVARARPSGGSCNRWAWQCDNGQGWACRNFDRYC